MQIIGSAPPQPSKEDLLAALKETVKQMIAQDVSAEIEPERQDLYRKVLKNDFYWRGLQFLKGTRSVDGNFGYTPVGLPKTGEDNAGIYDYVQNIYRGDGKKFIAVLGQRSPNVKAEADDPHDEESIRRAHMADTAASILDARWDSDLVNMQIVQGCWTSGPQFLYTPYVADGDKYGWREEPQYETQSVPTGDPTYNCVNCGAQTPPASVNPQQPACPQCGAAHGPEDLQQDSMDIPQMTGMQKYPNGMVELHLCDLFTVTVPFHTKKIEDAIWLSYDSEEYKGTLLRIYPALAESGESGGDGDNSNGPQSRAQQASPSGSSRQSANMWPYQRIWFKTDAYLSVKDKELRQLLAAHFSDGLKVTLVKGEAVQLENEKLSDVWAVIKPEASKYLYCDPSGQDMIPAQDLTNDMVNIAAETLTRGLSVTFMDSTLIDGKLWSERQAKPVEVMPVLTNGEPIGNRIFESQPAQFSNQMAPFLSGIQQQSREIVGVLPAIFGGDGGANQTARGAELQKNAALQQLATVWLGMRKGWEKGRTNAVKQLARYGAGTLTGTRKNGAAGSEALLLDVAELKEDGWHFEAEEAIPETWGQKRDLWMFQLEKPQPIIDAMGLLSPLNLELNASLMGFEGQYIPGLDQLYKVRGDIQQLLKQKVVQVNGGTQPSIPVDEWEDDHQAAVNVIKAWCLSPAGIREKQSNLDGYSNVLAFGKAHEALIPKPPGPPPPPPPGVSFTGKLEDMPQLVAPVLASHGVTVPPPPPTPPVGTVPPSGPVQPPVQTTP